MTVSSGDEKHGARPAALGDPRPSPGDRALPVLLLAAIVVASCLPALATGTYFVRDIMLQYIPARTLLTDSLSDGRFPLWNPLLHAGQPFLANPQNMASYPPWLLSCVLPLLTGFNLAVVSHLVLAAVSAWWLGRTLGLARAPSFLVGFSFAFCGVVVSLVSLTHMLFTLAWMPCLIACWIRLDDEPRARRVAAAGLVGGMTVLAGGIEMILVSFVTLGVVSLARFDRRVAPRSFALLAGVVAISMSIGAVRLWTTWDYLAETSRAESQEYSEMVRFSVHPHRLPELIAPRFMGSPHGIALSQYHGRNLEQAIPYLFSIHFGAGALLLAGVGMASRESGLSTSMRMILGGLAVGAVVLSLGRYLPGFEVTAAIPFVSRLRYPIKVIAFAALPIAVLAGAGAQALSSMAVARRRRIGLVAGLVAIVFAVLALSAGSSAGRELWSDWFLGGIRPEEFGRLSASLAVPAAVLALLGTLLALPRIRRVAIVALACGELFFGSQGVNPVAPRAIFDPPESVELLRRTTGDGYFQRVRPEAASIQSAEDSDVWYARWLMEVYELYTAYLWQLPQVFHSDFDGLAPERVIRLRDIAATADAAARERILELAGVRAVMMNELVYAPGLELVSTIRGPGAETLFLYRHETSGSVRFIANPIFVATPREAEERIRSAGFDGTREVVIEAAPRRAEPCSASAAHVEHERLGPNGTRTLVENGCAGYLVLAETALPGWTTTVDGVEVPTSRANVAFTSVWLESGAHDVSREYRPKGLTVTVALSVGTAAAALVVCLGGLGVVWRRRRSTRIAAGRG